MSIVMIPCAFIVSGFTLTTCAGREIARSHHTDLTTLGGSALVYVVMQRHACNCIHRTKRVLAPAMACTTPFNIA
eukprot:1160622-Pelagomonas_calceolata.AAC.8